MYGRRFSVLLDYCVEQVVLPFSPPIFVSWHYTGSEHSTVPNTRYIYLVECGEDVDQVIILGQGRIAHQGPFAELQNTATAQRVAETVESPGSSGSTKDIDGVNTTTADPQPTHEDEQEAEDLATTSDSALYLFYFESIGLKFGLTVIFLAVLPVFLSQFTRKCPRCLQSPATEERQAFKRNAGTDQLCRDLAQMVDRVKQGELKERHVLWGVCGPSMRQHPDHRYRLLVRCLGSLTFTLDLRGI